MKKQLFLLFALLSCFTSAWGDGVNIDGIYYIFREDNTATVTYKALHWIKNAFTIENDYEGNVVIPETVTYDGIEYTVTSLGEYSFCNSKNLTSVTIPNSVTSFGDDSFRWCRSLDSITIPNSVTSLGNYCFYDCSGLTSITIPNSVTSLGDGCFKRCSGLTSITIPNSVTSLGNSCFEDCSGLTSIAIPNSVTSLGEYCFAYCWCLTSISFPNSVTSLGKACFLGCTGLTSITIPNSVTYLGQECFSDCGSLREITMLPPTPPETGAFIFGQSSANKTIYVLNNKAKAIYQETKPWSDYTIVSLTCVSIPPLEYEIDKETHTATVTGLSLPTATQNITTPTTITIPESIIASDETYRVTSIENNCFSGYTDLTSVTIPKSVTSLGKECFMGCTGLNSLIIPNTIESIGRGSFNDATYPIYSYPRNYDNLKSLYGDRVSLYGAPLYEITNIKTTQTTISLKISDTDYIPAENGEELIAVEKKVYKEDYRTVLDSISSPASSDEYLKFEDCQPCIRYTFKCYVKYSDGVAVISDSEDIDAKGTDPSISAKTLTPTMIEYRARFMLEDAHISKVFLDGESVDPSLFIPAEGSKFYDFTFKETGLDPNCTYKKTLSVSTAEGSNEYDDCKYQTPELELTTLQPKCVSDRCAIVAATTNMSEEETNAGFQWKKYDAPESLAPNEAYAAIYDGQLEGYLKNLQSAFYYNVRAFYKSNTGEYYYSDWVTFDPSDFSYFEPTVHTYPVTHTTDCTASVRGYALAGTDEITEQGFEYWEAAGGAAAPKQVKAAELAPAEENIYTVLASGQVMQVVLDGLKPQTTYIYRAFVRTASGTTYGEEQTFTTNVPTGIENTETEKAVPTIIGYYDLSGRQLAGKQSGLVIVRYSDGTSRKLIVK